MPATQTEPRKEAQAFPPVARAEKMAVDAELQGL